jgi:chromosome segregation ATPase
MSRNDYLEALAQGEVPLMETVQSQPQPFMEVVETERGVDEVNIEKQPDTELYPFIETVLGEVESVKLELEAVRAENHLLQLGSSSVEVESLNQELVSVRSQLETVRAENEKLKSSQPLAQVELPEAADLLNRLKTKRKKSKTDLADLEAILEILES